MGWLDTRREVVVPMALELPPVREAIVELRFDSKLPDDAVFGVAYECIANERQWKVGRLPLLEIPEQIRARDQSLRFQPHFRLEHENLVVQIGPRVVTFANIHPYLGWASFSSFVFDYISRFDERLVTQRTHRIGVRYINLMPENVWELLNIAVQDSEGSVFTPKQLTLNAEIDEPPTVTKLKITGPATVTVQGESTQGAILDVDAILSAELYSLESKLDAINELHLLEKQTFFALLKSETISSLGPSYE